VAGYLRSLTGMPAYIVLLTNTAPATCPGLFYGFKNRSANRTDTTNASDRNNDMLTRIFVFINLFQREFLGMYLRIGNAKLTEL